ncbi:GIY-YIG nuclease family protein [Aureimonas sp. D3]|uniref:GIY-YIG nuclease family protein n=1 Tax=Aureimonas sp. D3 TaxID=1638164 RepID=UPI000781F6DE|nr:GIY-YIG nuclease family protein [Aureimonas sp. D3]
MNALPSDVIGQSIKLFLVDGSPNGLVVASIPNWTGSVVVASNLDLPRLMERPEADRAGCYILQSDPDAEEALPTAYIGQARKLSTRLTKHQREKDWWVRVAIISTSDFSFTSAHYMALESKMIQLAKQGGHVALDNGNSPDEAAGVLGEADLVDVSKFLSQLCILLPVLGFNALRPPVSAKMATSSSEADLRERFELSHPTGAAAQAVIVDGNFIVLAGSSANAHKEFAHNNYRHLRDKLIAEGVMIPSEDARLLTFARDFAFRSPSAAAAVILNRQANGPRDWRAESDNSTLSEWLARRDKAANPDREEQEAAE